MDVRQGVLGVQGVAIIAGIYGNHASESGGNHGPEYALGGSTVGKDVVRIYKGHYFREKNGPSENQNGRD